MQGWKTQVQQLKEYFEEFTIFQSCIFSRSAVSWSRPVHLYCTRPVLYTRNRTPAQKGLGSKIAGATLSSNSRRQTVYTHCTSVHQATKLVAALLTAAWRKVMAAYHRVYDSRHLQADYQEPGSAPEPYVRQTSIGYLYFFTSDYLRYLRKDNLQSTCPSHLKMHHTNL